MEDLLSISRNRRKNSAVLAKLQLVFLSEIIGDESAVKRLKNFAQERALSLSSGTPPPDEAARKLRAAVENGLQFHRGHANCLRQIGSGIAWRAFDYDRAVMHLLSQRATEQQASVQGTARELQEWMREFGNPQRLALLNVVTNSLGIGDVTVVDPDGGGEIVEVKTSNAKSRRITRQKRQMREVVELLNVGHGKIAEKEVTILHLDIFPANDLNRLLGLLDRASVEGWSAGRINNCCYVQCMNMSVKRKSHDVIAELDASAEAEAASLMMTGDSVTQLTSLDVLAFTPNCMPFSIFPFPAKRCAELMTGIASYRSIFNVSAFFRELERFGWRFKRTGPQIAAESGGFAQLSDAVGEVEKDGFRLSISPGQIMKLQMEMLRPSVIAEELDAIRVSGLEHRPQWGFALFTREREIWD
jgi:hypothetical protein